MKCNSKIKHTCSSTNYATCIHWEGEVNEQSSLIDNDCFNIQETTQDQYEQLEKIWNEVDLGALGETCLEYILDDNNKIIVKNVLLKFEEKICELLQKVETLENRPLCDMPIGDCVDTLCLELPCEQSIATYADWMNAVTARICE